MTININDLEEQAKAALIPFEIKNDKGEYEIEPNSYSIQLFRESANPCAVLKLIAVVRAAQRVVDCDLTSVYIEQLGEALKEISND